MFFQIVTSIIKVFFAVSRCQIYHHLGEDTFSVLLQTVEERNVCPLKLSGWRHLKTQGFLKVISLITRRPPRRA